MTKLDCGQPFNLTGFHTKKGWNEAHKEHLSKLGEKTIHLPIPGKAEVNSLVQTTLRQI